MSLIPEVLAELDGRLACGLHIESRSVEVPTSTLPALLAEASLAKMREALTDSESTLEAIRNLPPNNATRMMVDWSLVKIRTALSPKEGVPDAAMDALFAATPPPAALPQDQGSTSAENAPVRSDDLSRSTSALPQNQVEDQGSLDRGSQTPRAPDGLGSSAHPNRPWPNVCLLCGRSQPCMTDEEGLRDNGPGSPCTFEFPVQPLGPGVSELAPAVGDAPWDDLEWRAKWNKDPTHKTFIEMLNALRSGEGSSVTLLCDNPDFNGLPNNAVECSGSWTGWVDRRFTGDTIQQAIQSAFSAFSSKGGA